jgi:hypothetical protein
MPPLPYIAEICKTTEYTDACEPALASAVGNPTALSKNLFDVSVLFAMKRLKLAHDMIQYNFSNEGQKASSG